jgi:hypothetical protein
VTASSDAGETSAACLAKTAASELGRRSEEHAGALLLAIRCPPPSSDAVKVLPHQPTLL